MSSSSFKDRSSSLPGAEKKERRFSCKDEVIDALYHRTSDDLFEEIKDPVFKYEQTEEGHVITVDQRLRFVRKENDVAVSCQSRGSPDQPWQSEVTHSVMRGFINKPQSLTPVMWPLQNNSGAYNNFYIIQLVNDTWKSAIQRFNAEHPHYLDTAEKKKKILQAELVFKKKSKNFLLLQHKMSYRHCVKQWWKFFVDREVFKGLISVVGTRSSSPVHWITYANISALPNIQLTLSNVRALGPAAALLAPKPWSQWSQVSVSDLLPPHWSGVWNDVMQRPARLPQVIVEGLLKERTDQSADEENTLDWACAAAQQKILTPPFGEQKEIWEAYGHLETQREKWKPREREMLLHACIGGTKSTQFPLNIIQKSERIVWFMTIWKKVNPEDYKRWSTGDILKWRQNLEVVLAHDPHSSPLPEDLFRYNNVLRARYEKAVLADAVEANAPAARARPRRM